MIFLQIAFDLSTKIHVIVHICTNVSIVRISSIKIVVLIKYQTLVTNKNLTSHTGIFLLNHKHLLIWQEPDNEWDVFYNFCGYIHY